MNMMYVDSVLCTNFRIYPGCEFFYNDQHFCTLFSQKVVECDGIAGPPFPDLSLCGQKSKNDGVLT